MQPERRPPCGPCLVSVALLATLSVAPRAEAQTLFNPLIALESVYTDNVTFSPRAEEDTYSILSVALPVVRKTPRSTFSLSYEPSYQKFHDTEAFDNLAQSLTLGLTHEPSPVSSFDLRARFSSTQEQADIRSLNESDLFLTSRLESQSGRLGVDYRNRLRGRWQWRASLSAESLDFEPVKDTPAPIGPIAEDRVSFGASAEIAREISRRSTLGLTYDWSRFDLDLSGQETAQAVLLVIGRKVSDRVSARLALGAFRRSGETLDSIFGTTGVTEEGLRGSLELDRSFRRSILRLEAGHEPTAGGDQSGTATTSRFGVSISSADWRSWDWGLFARYARRDPTDPSLAELESTAVGVLASRAMTRVFWIRFFADHFDQSSRPSSQLEISVLQAGLSLVAYPRGRAASGRRP